ncbi:MAG: hypothetical protein H0Z28_04430 [Archaeoglobus sp.]|nr:hypothetical protein [Archaeoglobus sp.]
MIEEVHDIEEFKNIVREGCRLRYQILVDVDTFHGVIMGGTARLEIWGIAKEGHITKYVESKSIKGLMKPEEFQEKIAEIGKELEEKAKNLGARKGRYYE